MRKEAVVTLRIPVALKRILAARAREEKRSLSAQIALYLERAVERDVPPSLASPGRLLGLYEGTPVPSEEDFALVRRMLWGSLGRRSTYEVDAVHETGAEPMRASPRRASSASAGPGDGPAR